MRESIALATPKRGRGNPWKDTSSSQIVQTQKTEKKEVKPGREMNLETQDELPEDWKQERLEADSLLRSLHKAHSEDEKHRKWLLKSWPERPGEGLSDSLPDSERFIPECFLRECEDDSESLQSVKTLVRGGIDLLQGEDGKDQQPGGRGLDPRLSDEGVGEVIPALLPRLKNWALQSILSSLSTREKNTNNRPWLIKKINCEWMKFFGHLNDINSLKIFQKILAVVRNPDSFHEKVSGQSLLDHVSHTWSAADARVELEIESTLRISSHLLQIMYNWKEVPSERSSKKRKCNEISLSYPVDFDRVSGIGTLGATEVTPQTSSSSRAIQARKESLAATMNDDDDGVDQDTILIEGDFFEESTPFLETSELDDGVDVDSNVAGISNVEIKGQVEKVLEDLLLTRIADEAAEVGYALVGGAMERTANACGVSLKRPVRKYLRCGAGKKVRAYVDEHQLAMIFNIAEKIPAISPRVMDNVKRRLGMG